MRQNTVETTKSAARLVCDRTEPFISNFRKKVFDPGCGSGTFLLEALARRLEKIRRRSERITPLMERDILIAVSNLYGVDILHDAVDATRQNIYNYICTFLDGHIPNYRFFPQLDMILQHNIIVGDLLRDWKKIRIVEWKVENGCVSVLNNSYLGGGEMKNAQD